MILFDVVPNPDPAIRYSPPKNLTYHPDTANRNILVPGYQDPTTKTEYSSSLGPFGAAVPMSGWTQAALFAGALLAFGGFVYFMARDSAPARRRKRR